MLECKKHGWMVRLVALALVLAVPMTVCVTGAEAYCVYNKTNHKIKVKQVGGDKDSKGMKRTIDPHKKACCNWQNEDCNRVGDQDSIVRFEIRYTQDTPNDVTGLPDLPATVYHKSMQAADALLLTGPFPKMNLTVQPGAAADVDVKGGWF